MTIKINLITYNNQYGLTNDLRLIGKLLKKHFHDRVEIKIVDFYHYKAPQADINIFLETVSKILFKHALVNVLIPNQEWFYRSWLPYLKEIDKIYTKTVYGNDIFSSILGSERKGDVKMIGWRSLDRKKFNVKKNYQQYLHVCGRSKHKQSQTIIDAWKPEYPTLKIIYSPKDVPLVKRSDLNNIEYLTERLSEEDLEKIMNECGVHICCSETEGYGHYIHEAKSCGAVVITSNAPPMKDFITDDMGYLVKCDQKKTLKKHLGSKYLLDVEDFQRVIETIMATDPKKLKMKGEMAVESFLKDAKIFEEKFKNDMTELFSLATDRRVLKESKLKEEQERLKTMMKDENLPHVSIITPTYNRRRFFKLAMANFINFNYPRDKMEWIIVDDGSDKILDLIQNNPDLVDNPMVKYYSLDEKKPIGFKRNYCVEKATNPYIVCMDDDDYYYPNSIKLRILELLNSGKDCLTCSSIGCFEVNKYISMVNVPPHRLPFSERISEASLCFKKSFWEEQKFKDQSSISEAKEFLAGRENQTYEISWEGIFVALLHNRNTSDKIIIDQSPNGSHYGWNDQVFLFITGLDEPLTEEEEQAKKKKTTVRTKDPDNDGHLPE
jgi:glycosyltransferase involved in cell wall biosynthesis